jgi:hypothetical protein
MRFHFELDFQRDFFDVRREAGKFCIHFNLWGEEKPK